MNIRLTSVLEAGVAIRTLRKRAGIRIDDFALTAGVSKQFMTDLENGKATIQMGKVLQLLDRLGLGVGLALPDAEVASYRKELSKALSRQTFRPPKRRRMKPAQPLAATGDGTAARESVPGDRDA
ncbi:helix-turn-helix transcriptional regulator [Achromobacter sp. GG226]|uniref:helix-turn-helix domain-containing protein n=1 Tax=Verticiella alkaliphila TaxID=2779529 RepID=UPI001C0C670D|nr:helix-turn-helix domain-containing protein [Verticiella sp. GG226]MBU4610926.1 helix-turn-helix transcriptional regulator [Verticiella sp. GG226]